MGLRITGTSGFSFGPLHRTQGRLEGNLARLAAGKRINSAADDPAGLAIAARLTAAERGLAQGERNLQDGVSLAQTAEGSLSSTSDSLGRMRELAIQAGNGTLTTEDRAAIQGEYDQLAAEITRTSQATSFGGRNLLDGSAGGSGAVPLVDGTGGDPTLVDIGDQSAAALGVAGLAVGDPATLTALDQAIDQTSRARASLGTTERSLGHHTRSLGVARENAAAARSRIEDLDFAVAVAELTRDKILRQSQIALLGQAKSSARSALNLLA